MTEVQLKNFYSGLSGLQVPFPRHMYPDEFQNASRLKFYSNQFNSIEINSSFYKVPRGKTIEKWLVEVPDDFRFTFKIWKQITHNPLLEFNEVDVYSFMDAVAAADGKKGCLLLQLPPSCGVENLHQLNALLSIIQSHNKTNEWDLAVEFRNSSWYKENVYELTGQHNAAIVIHDMKKSATPFVETEMKIKYIRFHGPEGSYRGTYTDDFLEEYALYVTGWLREGQKVYFYFNNTMGKAYDNLKSFNNILKRIEI